MDSVCNVPVHLHTFLHEMTAFHDFSSSPEHSTPGSGDATDAGPPASPRRSFRARRGLPTGRAVVGALLITIAGVGAFAVARSGSDQPTTEYLVLVRDIEPGGTVSLDDVAFEAMDLSPAVAANALRTTSGLEGATALRLLRVGELVDVRTLRGAAFVDGERLAAVHELTFPVRRSRTPPRLDRGDRVTILAHTDTDVLTTALEDAIVLSYDTTASGVGGGDGVLTLALADSGLVTRAALLSYDEDQLTVVLTSRALEDTYPDQFQLETGAAPTIDPPTEPPESG